MKVLIWVKRFPVFSETFIRDQIIGLLDAGIEVLINTKTGIQLDEELDALSGFESYNLNARVLSIDEYYKKNKLKRILVFIRILSCVVFSTNLKYYIKALNFRIYGKKASSLRLFYRVHFLLKNKIDVIHAHFGPHGNEAVMLKQLGLPIKFITTFHGYDTRLGIKKGGSIYKSLFSYADGIIAISEYNKKYLLKFGLSKKTLIDLPNGIDVNSFKRERVDEVEGTTIKLLSVARLVPEKALHIAIEALARVQKEIPQYFLDYTVIGDGPERERLENLVTTLGIADHVIFLGSQSSLVVQDAMKRHDIFLLSSLDEALPTVLLEAQASGMMVLATDVGSVNQIVKSGLIVPSGNVDAFGASIIELIGDRVNWQKEVIKGREFISKYYNIERQIERLIEIYKTN